MIFSIRCGVFSGLERAHMHSVQVYTVVQAFCSCIQQYRPKKRILYHWRKLNQLRVYGAILCNLYTKHSDTSSMEKIAHGDTIRQRYTWNFRMCWKWKLCWQFQMDVAFSWREIYADSTLSNTKYTQIPHTKSFFKHAHFHSFYCCTATKYIYIRKLCCCFCFVFVVCVCSQL